MRFFSDDRQNDPPPPPPSDDAVLAYLDSCLEGRAPRTPRPAHLDLMDRVLELTSSDWSEDEAGAELAWLADYDANVLDALSRRLIAGLVRNPFLDVLGVRAGRVTLRALQHCTPAAERRAWRSNR